MFGLADIFKLFPAEYFVVPRVHDYCPPGSSQIKNQEECRQVALKVFLGPGVGIHNDFSIDYHTSQSYCGVNIKGKVQFNRHPNGRRAGFVRSVCKRQKTIVPDVVPLPPPVPTITGFSMIYNGMIHNPQP